MPLVGNDVVDLATSEDKSRDDRFVSRVLTAFEKEILAGSPMPKETLWLLWAAKEAAYKAISARLPDIVSIPRRYEVTLEGISWRSGLPSYGLTLSDTGSVKTPGGDLKLLAVVTANYIHAVAVEPGAEAAGIAQSVARMGDGGNAGDPSAFVRALLLDEVSRRYSLPREELTVGKEAGSETPHVYRAGNPLSIALSLSHDGRFVAYAFLPGCIILKDLAGGIRDEL